MWSVEYEMNTLDVTGIKMTDFTSRNRGTSRVRLNEVCVGESLHSQELVLHIVQQISLSISCSLHPHHMRGSNMNHEHLQSDRNHK